MSKPKTTVNAKRVTRGVLSYLTRSNQLNLLPQVAREALRLSRTKTDPSTAQVDTAIALNDQEQITLKTALSSLFGRPLNLVSTVNPDLIGGLRIRVGDQVIDQSFSYQIDKIGQKINI
jgi:F-type H+-transporting ATPase subunit delta